MKTKKPLMTAMAVALVAALGIGGTIAWLTDETDSVTNTFTAGDVEITLAETLYKDGSYSTPVEGVSNAYQMIPGATYTKDPVVTVEGGSEKCYLFVKFEEVGNPSTYLNYTSTLTTGESWTQGTGTIPSNVWYRIVEASDSDQSWHLLLNDTISVKGDAVTAENMTTATGAQLIYTAYAVQFENIADAAEAWAKVAPQS